MAPQRLNNPQKGRDVVDCMPYITERIFSALSATITPSRNRLNLGTAFDLISLRINSFSRGKSGARRRLSGSQLDPRSEPEDTLDGLEVHLDSSLSIVGDEFDPLASQENQRIFFLIQNLESALILTTILWRAFSFQPS